MSGVFLDKLLLGCKTGVGPRGVHQSGGSVIAETNDHEDARLQDSHIGPTKSGNIVVLAQNTQHTCGGGSCYNRNQQIRRQSLLAPQVLRSASANVLDEMERAVDNAVNVVRCVAKDRNQQEKPHISKLIYPVATVQSFSVHCLLEELFPQPCQLFVLEQIAPFAAVSGLR
eukprot:6412803-Amphidinium_carterae.1